MFSIRILIIQLSKRWRSLSEDERTIYKDQEAADRERFDRESREADEAAIAAQEARRQALTVQEGESHSSRGARGYVDQRRAAKEESRRKRKEAAALNYDSEEEEARAAAAAAKKRETKERRRKRQEEEQAVQKQHNKIDKEEAKRTTKRLEYLLGQSSIFSRIGISGNHLQKFCTNFQSLVKIGNIFIFCENRRVVVNVQYINA